MLSNFSYANVNFSYVNALAICVSSLESLATSFANILSQSRGCPLMLFIVPLSLFIFAFISITLGDWPKDTLVQFMPKSILPLTSSRSFMVSYLIVWASLVAQRLKHLPPMRETGVRSLGQEDPLEKETVTHFSIFAWRIPWKEEPGRLRSTGSQRVGHDWATSLHFTYLMCGFSR